MHKLVLIGIGGLFGTLSRFWISQFVDARSHSAFPYGTMVVNFAGCFAAGFLFQALEQTTVFSPELRLAIFTGFLGGFTTFSAYGLQTFVMARGGMMTLAATNAVVSNVGGLMLVWIGSGVARGLVK